LEILELLAGQPSPMAMPEIAKKLGRSKTEIYRMLVVLETRGYIARGEHDERYEITSRLFELGMRNPPIRNLHDAALPAMHALAEQTMQSCHLGIIAGDQVVIVARVESPAAVGFAVRVGHRVPIFLSASGRVIFGAQPEEKRAALTKHLKGAVPKADLDKFLAEAKKTAERGYLLEPSRMTEGIRDIGAPVFDGEAMGAVASLTMPYVTHRYAEVSLQDAIKFTVKAAQDISSRLRNG
jgi:DNA-binding IclR family transcriptional regulator